MKSIETQEELSGLAELNSEWAFYESCLENTSNYKPTKLISFKTIQEA